MKVEEEGFELTSGFRFKCVNGGLWYFGPFNRDDIEEQPEKKLHSEGFESEGELEQLKAEDEGKDQDEDFNAGESESEREWKQLISEDKSESESEDGDGDFYDFYDGDSDVDDLKSGCDILDGGVWDYEDIDTSSYPDDVNLARSCLEKPICHMYTHNSIYGVHLFFELFKVVVIRNPKYSSGGGSPASDGYFCGAIDLIGSENYDDPISYYSVSEKQSVFINFNPVTNKYLLPISNPNPVVPVPRETMMILRFSNFKFDGGDVIGSQYNHEDIKLDGWRLIVDYQRMARGYRRPGWFPPYIARDMIGNPDRDPFLVIACYSFYSGLLANVSVNILKRGVTSCSGFIYARPCIYASRICLLNLQKEKLELDSSGSVKLTRSVVAVPSFSSLIITAHLYDQNDKKIFHDRAFFPALDEGNPCEYIKAKDGDGNLQVTVNWSLEP